MVNKLDYPRPKFYYNNLWINILYTGSSNVLYNASDKQLWGVGNQDRDNDDQDISEASYDDKQNILENCISIPLTRLKSGKITFYKIYHWLEMPAFTALNNISCISKHLHWSKQHFYSCPNPSVSSIA